MKLKFQDKFYNIIDHNKCPSSEKQNQKCILRKSYFHQIQPNNTIQIRCKILLAKSHVKSVCGKIMTPKSICTESHVFMPSIPGMDFTKPPYCEAQARVRQGSARDGSQCERPQSLNPCLELTLKLVATTTHHQKFNFTQLMARWRSGAVGADKERCVGSLWQ